MWIYLNICIYVYIYICYDPLCLCLWAIHCSSSSYIFYPFTNPTRNVGNVNGNNKGYYEKMFKKSK